MYNNNNRRTFTSSNNSERQPSSARGNNSYRREGSQSSDSRPRRFNNDQSSGNGGAPRRWDNNRSGGRNTGGRGFNRGGNNGGGNRSKRFQPQNLDVSLFVKKATFKEKAVYVPVNSYDSFPIQENLKMNIKRKGYSNPTPIQDMAIPMILQNKDVIGIANTGTGKTAAFLVPLINKCLTDRNQKVLIIIPTRELAVQIREELVSLTAGMNINNAVCIGGSDIKRQIINIKKNPNFVIATPGRLKDLLMRRHINLSMFNNIVLDEVDRMLDMGFYPEIKFLVEKMPEQKQSLFFSATMSSKIETIANSFLKSPEKIMIKTQETSENIEQDVVIVDNQSRKLEILHDLLSGEDFSKVLIFSRTKHGAEKLQNDLFKKGHKVDSIHGDKSQSKRQKALDTFKQGNSTILIATDVVARGIDVADISHVINYDIPNTYEDYIHRIGRTGRGNKTGKALTFIDKK